MFFTWTMGRAVVSDGTDQGRAKQRIENTTGLRGLRPVAKIAGLATVTSMMAGCGAGVLSEGITGLSTTAVALDAGQTYTFDAQVTGNPNVAWSLSGTDCVGTSCGELSSTTGGSVRYTAPTAVAKAQNVVLKATMTGTQALGTTATISLSPKMSLAGMPLPSTTQGAAYSTELTVVGGMAPFQWSVANGSLPAGVSLDGKTGRISGTPLTTGNFSFSVQVADASVSGATAQATYTMAIVAPSAPLAFAIGALPRGTAGKVYSAQLQALGGVQPYSFSVAGGSLPAGLTFSPSGVIAGTPTSSGTSALALRVTDVAGSTASATLPVSILPAPLALVSTALPDASIGTSYTSSLPIAGGTAPYTCSAASGSLPTGLTLNGCTVSGTAMVPGSGNVTIQVTDSGSPSNVAVGAVNLNVMAASLKLTTTALPQAILGLSYTALIGASGGTAPYSCGLTSGTLPAGLSLSGCTISGRMTGANGNAFTIQVRDASSPAKSVTGSFTIQQATAPLTLLGNTLANGTVGVSYSTKVVALGGIAPYTCSVSGGALPVGLGLSNCAVTGVPTAAGSGSVTLKVTDAQSPAAAASGTLTWSVAPGGLALATKTLPTAKVGAPYAAPLSIAGGVAPYSCTIKGASLPAGMSLSGCTIAGTPTAPASTPVTIGVTDAATPASSVTGTLMLNVSPSTLSISTTALTPGKTGSTYSSTIALNGGIAPYTCAVAGGALPAGLSLSGCLVSGTPSKSGSGNVTISARDGASPAQTTTAALSWTVAAADLKLLTAMLPTQEAGSTYSTALAVSGGTAPYACSLTGGTLPTGLALTGCSVTGKASQGGTGSATIKVVDASSPQGATSGLVSWTVTSTSLSLSATSLPQTTVGKWYTVKVPVTGGAPPYTCSVTGGQLTEGLALQGCTVVGTPQKPGIQSFSVRVADTSAQSVSGSLGLVVKPSASTASVLALTTTSLPNGTAAVFYSSTITAAGGTPPYSCAIGGGTLPSGLALSGCSVSGTPTVASTGTFTVKVTDAGSPAQAASGTVSLAIAPPVLTLASATLPPGVVGQPYAGSISATGGTPAYRYSVASGSLPAGLTLGVDGSISGSPTAYGTANFTAQVTDAGSPQVSASHPFSITVTAAALSLSSASLPPATTGQTYSATIGVTGGTAPYSCGLVSGALPTGLSLNGCKITGVPTAAASATVTVTVKATDASAPLQTASGTLTVSVAGSPMTITTSSLANANKGVPYSATINTSGGSGAVSCAVTGGSLPSGLQLNGGSCSITGTPTDAGGSSVTITATDQNKPNVNTAVATLGITVNGAALSLDATQLPNPVLGQTFTQKLSATGGQAPYSFSIANGTLPRGLTLSATGVISGTPTAAGASSFVVSVSDSAASTETATQTYVPLVAYPSGANNAQLSGSYAFLVQGFDPATGGDLAYETATVGSFTADGAGLISSGELDSNHQGSPAVAQAHLVGTYEVAADDRGLVTLTVINADGTTGVSSTYAIAAAASVAADGSASAADVAAAGGEPMMTTGAPGMLLAQDKTAFAKALKGSYAFGMKGDTPCMTTCVTGIKAGPVAEVGQFTVNSSGAVTSGTSDSNIASTNYPSASLSGSTGSADSNGRVALTLNTAGTPAGVYPSSYAVYVIDANQAVLMSTDSHATHVLLSGTAQLQTQNSFTNGAMSGAFVGAVNATVDPSSLGISLGSITNSGTATIFRGTASADGTCSLTHVDIAGTAQLTAAVQAGGGNADGITALLGARAATGPVTCAVSSNGRGVLTAPMPSTAISNSLNSLGLATIAEASRVFYLTAPGRGYFLETGNAALGGFEPQTGAPFTGGSLNGSYDFGTGSGSTAASDAGSGTMLANGSGSVTITLDGGLDSDGQMTTGASKTVTYSLTDAAAGRISVKGVVLYALSPDRLLRLDETAAAVSPSVGSLER